MIPPRFEFGVALRDVFVEIILTIITLAIIAVALL